MAVGNRGRLVVRENGSSIASAAARDSAVVMIPISGGGLDLVRTNDLHPGPLSCCATMASRSARGFTALILSLPTCSVVIILVIRAACPLRYVSKCVWRLRLASINRLDRRDMSLHLEDYEDERSRYPIVVP